VSGADSGSSTGLWLYDATRGRMAVLAWLGAALGLSFLGVWALGIAFVAGPEVPSLAETPAFGPRSWGEAIVRSLVLGYIVTLPAAGLHVAEQQLKLLRPHLDAGSSAAGAAASAVVRVPRWLRWLGGASGLAVLLLFGPDFVGSPGELLTVTQGWLAASGMLLGRAVAVHLFVARSFANLGRNFIPVDLLDRRPFAPLVAWGLRTFLAWVIWFGLTSLFFIDPGPRPPNWSNLLGLIPLAMIGVGALLVPVWGIHGRLREAKTRELERLDAAVRAERDALWQGVPSESPQLANLSGYRMLVADQSDWPLDVSAWLRFGFYLAIGAGSWIGAALVEQLLGRALG